MGKKLQKKLAKHRDRLIQFVVTGLLEADLAPYQDLEPAELAERATPLVDGFLEATGGSERPFLPLFPLNRQSG